MQGLVQKVSQRMDHNSLQVLDLTKRGMEQNLIIQGVDDEIEINDAKQETPMFTFKERPKQDFLLFLKKQMNISLEIDDVWKAHRTGIRKEGKVRPMVVKLSYSAKELIMDNLSSLKGKKNDKTKQTFFISEQIPEGIAESKKQTTARLNFLKEQNEKKPKEERSKIQVINDKILINDKLDALEVKTPKPSELFVDPKKQQRIDELQSQMFETDSVTVRNSEFTALSLKVHSTQQVQEAYIGVMQRYPASDHVILAYALKEEGKLKHGGCDDKEYGAAAKIKKMIFEGHCRNTAVFVIRNYGGVHIGFDRFKAIENIASKAIEMIKEHYP